MSENFNFRKLRGKLGPAWLTTAGESGLVGYSLDLVKDAFIDRLYAGLLARFPQNDPTGATTAPDDALSAMGRDRRVVRGINETSASYAARLRRWLDDRRTAGNPFALMQKLAEYTGPLCSFRTVDARGNWYSRDAAGVETYALKQANWDWEAGASARRWARFWVIIYPGGLWSERPHDWGDVTDPGWGDPTGTWGSTAPADQVATIKFIVNDWKRGGSRCVNIIVAFDPASFDPAAAVDSAGMPDGTWFRWSKIVDGVAVPSRLATARYWDGV